MIFAFDIHPLCDCVDPNYQDNKNRMKQLEQQVCDLFLKAEFILSKIREIL